VAHLLIFTNTVPTPMQDPPPTPVSIGSAAHYTWGAGCDGWHLLRTSELSVIQERMPPSTEETNHHHTRARQFFFVPRGELQVEVAGVPHLLGPFTGLEIPPGVPHQPRNVGQVAAEFLVVSQPPSHGDRVPGHPTASPPVR